MRDAELTTKRSKLLDNTIFDENLLTERNQGNVIGKKED